MEFNNYVVKKRGEGVSRKSTLGHVTNGSIRYHVNDQNVRGSGGSKLGKLSST